MFHYEAMMKQDKFKHLLAGIGISLVSGVHHETIRRVNYAKGSVDHFIHHFI
jgi:hypothetical protein